MSLTFQMALATVLGILFGVVLGEWCAVFAPWANAYISILKITIVPYLLVTIAHGVGQFTSAQALMILSRGALFFGISWVLNIGVIYFAKALLPASGGHHVVRYLSSAGSKLNLADLLIPENIFNALAHNIIPAIVVFALLVGIALQHLSRKGPLMEVLEVFVAVFTKITAALSKITPVGTFLIMANQIGTVQFSTIRQVTSYLIVYVLALCIVSFWIYPRLTNMLTPIKPGEWIRAVVPALVLAYTTNVVIVALPYIIQIIQQQLKALHPKEDSMQNLVQGTVSVIFNLPMTSMFIAVFIFFACTLYGTPLDLWQQGELFFMTMLIGIGSVGLGSWINNLTFLFDALSLPSEGINLYLTTVPFTAGFQSMTSVMQIASLALIVVLSCHKRLHYRWLPLCRKGLFTLAPLFALLLLAKIYNPFPPIVNTTPTVFELHSASEVEASVVSRTIPRDRRNTSGDLLSTILESGVLRVGYYPYLPPFCFYNRWGELVGYDISFAHELAKDLHCRLELVPLDYAHLEEDLDNRLYDIAMSAISVTAARLPYIAFTQPYLQTQMVLVVPAKRKKEFVNLTAVQHRKGLHIGTIAGSSYERAAQQLFPQATIVPIEDPYQFQGKVDLLFWEEAQSLPWLAFHPQYRIVTPSPGLSTDSLAYAVHPVEERWLNFLDQWLELKKTEGFTDAEYGRWIRGETEDPEASLQPELKGGLQNSW